MELAHEDPAKMLHQVTRRKYILLQYCHLLNEKQWLHVLLVNLGQLGFRFGVGIGFTLCAKTSHKRKYVHILPWYCPLLNTKNSTRVWVGDWLPCVPRYCTRSPGESTYTHCFGTIWVGGYLCAQTSRAHTALVLAHNHEQYLELIIILCYCPSLDEKQHRYCFHCPQCLRFVMVVFKRLHRDSLHV